ncbi:MAG: diadenylate cyclase CdaA [Bdellovibrionota bacterium]|nr:diadenylate cyclase CdaA [Bdellovibrionota bacterium]
MHFLDISYFNVRNIIDLILVTFLIYRALLLIKGTRAQAMLTGLFIIIVVYSVANYFELKTLSWILYQFLSSIIIILIVIFQDDIRRGLIKVGLGSIFKRQRQTSLTSDKVIDDLTLAATRLSKDKVGALIVIKRDVGLDDFIEEAVSLDAIVNRKLILAIFDKNSALHDGAMIIENERIKAAGCVLPLSYNPDLDPNLGTRHRAGLGISERCDAIVVIVSEETGGITICRDGKLSRNLDPVMLRESLQRFLLPINQKLEEM